MSRTKPKFGHFSISMTNLPSPSHHHHVLRLKPGGSLYSPSIHSLRRCFLEGKLDHVTLLLNTNQRLPIIFKIRFTHLKDTPWPSKPSTVWLHPTTESSSHTSLSATAHFSHTDILCWSWTSQLCSIFAPAAPSSWNILVLALHLAGSFLSFWSQLKCYLRRLSPATKMYTLRVGTLPVVFMTVSLSLEELLDILG